MDKSKYEKFAEENRIEIDKLKSEMDNGSIKECLQMSMDNLRDSIINQKDIYGFLTSVAMEECGELTQAISKLYRSRIITYTRDENTEYNIHEEMADVLMNIYRLIDLYELDADKIQDILAAKLIRFDKYAKLCREHGSFD